MSDNHQDDEHHGSCRKYDKRGSYGCPACASDSLSTFSLDALLGVVRGGRATLQQLAAAREARLVYHQDAKPTPDGIDTGNALRHLLRRLSDHEKAALIDISGSGRTADDGLQRLESEGLIVRKIDGQREPTFEIAAHARAALLLDEGIGSDID